MLSGKQPALGMSAAAAALVLQLHLLVPEDISGTYPAGLNRPSRNGCVSIYTEQCIANSYGISCRPGFPLRSLISLQGFDPSLFSPYRYPF